MSSPRNPYHGFRFPAEIISHAVWLYYCFSLSLRDVELILAARGLTVSNKSICDWGILKGGIAPPLRTRSRSALTEGEREEISRGLVAGLPFRCIAVQLGRSPSTIGREIGRNGGRKHYRAAGADERAWQKASRPKPCLLAINSQLRDTVAEKLQARWSPQQIAGWLKVEHGDDEAMRVSHETIYKSLFIQACGVLKRELLSNLRSRRIMRRAKTSTSDGQPRGRIIGAVSIKDRPAEVEDRAIPGHWEDDLVSGVKNTHIATLIERQSRLVMLLMLVARTAKMWWTPLSARLVSCLPG